VAVCRETGTPKRALQAQFPAREWESKKLENAIYHNRRPLHWTVRAVALATVVALVAGLLCIAIFAAANWSHLAGA